MTETVRIDELTPEFTATLEHIVAAMKDGETVSLTIDQIASLIIGAIEDGAPAALDTLNELAAALGDDPNFAATITAAIALKLDKTGANIGNAAAQSVFRQAIGFPAAVALSMLRWNAGATALENRTMAQVMADLGFPAGTALNYIRRNAGNTAWESRTPAQVLADIGAQAATGLSEKDFWGVCDDAGTLLAGRGVSSIVDDGVGLITVNLNFTFTSGTSYACNVTTYDGSNAAQVRTATLTGQTAGAFGVKCVNHTPSLADPVRWNFRGLGI